MLRVRERGSVGFSTVSFCLVCVFFPFFFSGVKVLHYCAYLTLPPLLTSPSLTPSPLLQCSPVTLAFSPNVNPNRLSTEGYCSSSQKRRQIFRYWGAADFDLCVAMPIFESDLVMIVVTCGGFYILAWRSRLIDGYSSTAPWGFPWPMHGCFVVHWGLIDLLTHPLSTTFLYKVTASLPQ